jgi:hypothetical protein
VTLCTDMFKLKGTPVGKFVRYSEHKNGLVRGWACFKAIKVEEEIAFVNGKARAILAAPNLWTCWFLNPDNPRSTYGFSRLRYPDDFCDDIKESLYPSDAAPPKGKPKLILKR